MCFLFMGVLTTMCSVSGGMAETVTVKMKDRVFTPERVVVKAGDAVRWENDDFEIHNVVSGVTLYDPDLGRLMKSGAIMWDSAYAFTFVEPGSYRYLCVIHSSMGGGEHVTGMVGEVVVTSEAPEGR